MRTPPELRFVHALRRHFPRPARAQPDLQIQVLDSLFFRNKGAYVIGRLINANGELPFAVPILQNERGELYLDALLVGEDQDWLTTQEFLGAIDENLQKEMNA